MEQLPDDIVRYPCGCVQWTAIEEDARVVYLETCGPEDCPVVQNHLEQAKAHGAEIDMWDLSS